MTILAFLVNKSDMIAREQQNSQEKGQREEGRETARILSPERRAILKIYAKVDR